MEIRIRSDQVPQSSKLAAVRSVVESIARKYSSVGAISADTGISVRHVSYHLSAGQILGFVSPQKTGFRITPSGESLLSTCPDSAEEKLAYKTAFAQTDLVKELLNDLIEKKDVKTTEIAAVLEAHTPLSAATAKRRASAIATWIKTIHAPPALPEPTED